ncbi:MAG: hypothetical protein U0Q07_19355 [Acidimicrobiales bacterium]
MRRTTAVLVGLAAACAGCSSGSSTASSPAGSAEADRSPATTAIETTASTQRRFRDEPACQALVRYKLAELAMGDGPPERRATARAAAGAAAQDLRTLLPQFAAQVDQLVSTLQRADAGRVTDADRAADRQAIEDLGAWYVVTCFDTTGGSLP